MPVRETISSGVRKLLNEREWSYKWKTTSPYNHPLFSPPPNVTHDKPTFKYCYIHTPQSNVLFMVRGILSIVLLWCLLLKDFTNLSSFRLDRSITFLSLFQGLGCKERRTTVQLPRAQQPCDVCSVELSRF